MKTTPAILPWAIAGLFLAGGPTLEAELPEKCKVSREDLEKPNDPPPGTEVSIIVTVNGVFQEHLSDGSPSDLTGTPAPTSVTHRHNWGPGCSAQVTFVFLPPATEKKEDDKKGKKEDDEKGKKEDGEKGEGGSGDAGPGTEAGEAQGPNPPLPVYPSRSLPVEPEPLSSIPGNFELPTIGQAGKSLPCPGPFDGDLNSTAVRIGGSEAELLAEPPRGLVIRPEGVPEPVTAPTISALPETVTPGNLMCVCGVFPSLEYLHQLTFGGRDLGPPVKGTGCGCGGYFHVPAVEPGLHKVGGPFTDEILETEAVVVSASMDQKKLWKGQGTQLHLSVTGASKELCLKLLNSSPGNIRVQGGDDQTICLSRGKEATRKVRGLKKGNFDLHWELLSGTCPCADRLPPIPEDLAASAG